MTFIRNHFLLMALVCMLWPLPAGAIQSITVMADPSLSVAVSQIARNYSRRMGVTVTTSYLPASVQQAQITEGAAADVLITPLPQWMEELKMQGLIDVYSPTPVAKNRLALIGPADSTLEIRWEQRFPVAKIIRLIGGDPGFVIGNPESLPEGAYAKEALHSMEAAADLEPYTLYMKRLEDIFERVRTHGAYGLVFYSNALGQDHIRIIDMLPETLHRPIQYYAMVIAGENMSAARPFLDYLKSDAAQKVFRDNGL